MCWLPPALSAIGDVDAGLLGMMTGTGGGGVSLQEDPQEDHDAFSRRRQRRSRRHRLVVDDDPSYEESPSSNGNSVVVANLVRRVFGPDRTGSRGYRDLEKTTSAAAHVKRRCRVGGSIALVLGILAAVSHVLFRLVSESAKDGAGSQQQHGRK